MPARCQAKPFATRTVCAWASPASWQKNYAISGTELLPEQTTRQIFFDAARSNPVEATYLLDKTDKDSKERVVSSLVLNSVSGDARIFHRRWIPPGEWRNSDQYLYSGNCKKLAG